MTARTRPPVVWTLLPQVGPLRARGPIPMLPGYFRNQLAATPPAGVDLWPCPRPDPHAAHEWVLLRADPREPVRPFTCSEDNQ